MGEKKRKPLRSHELTEKRPAKNLKVESHKGDSEGPKKGPSTAKSGNSAPESDEGADDDEWERIERQQSTSSGGRADSNVQEDAESSDDEDDEDDEIKLEGSIQHITEEYTFEFNDMRDEYTEGICVLLRSLVQNPTKAYELAVTISSQTLVGTVVTCEGGSDTFAFATVLPLAKQKLLGAEDPLNAMIQDLASAVRKTSASSSDAFLEFVTGPKVCTTGVMLHKRFSNLPIQLVGPLHINLEEDLGWAQHNHESDDSEQNDFLSMQAVLLVCSCSLVGDKGPQEGRALDVLGNAGLLFEYFEDEILTQSASSAFLFKPKGCATSLVAAVVPIASLKKCVNAVCLLIPPVET